MQIKKWTHRLLCIALMAVYCLGSLHATENRVEGEDFVAGKGYKGENVEVGTETVYSGNKYVEIENAHGEASVPLTIATAGNYTVKLYYKGFTDGDGSNIYYNLYNSNGYGSTPLQDGKIDDITSYGSREFDYNFSAGNYYIALYGNPGTIFDKVEIIQNSSVVQTLEAEDYETGKGFNDGNISIVNAQPVYSGGAYAIVTEYDGEAAVPFEITEPGAYAIELFYHGNNVHYNLYGEDGWDRDAQNEGKLTGSSIDDNPDSGSTGFTYTFTTAGTYHIALYGETGTIFDYAVITPVTYVWSPQGTSTGWADPNNWSSGVAPDATVDVIIPKSGSYPVLTGAAACKTITFQSGAELGGQDYLSYSNAIVQYSLEPGRWHILSMPFETTAQSFYLEDSHGREAWLQKFKSSNGLNADWDYYPDTEQPMPIGEGFAYWIQKFDNDGTDDVSFQIEKTKAASSLANAPVSLPLDFGQDDAYGTSSYFALVGNPFMTSINFDNLYDANKKTENPDTYKIKRNYQVFTDLGFKGYTYDGYFGVKTVVESGVGSMLDAPYIAPLQAFFVEKDAAEIGDNLLFDLSAVQATGGATEGLRAAANPGDKLDITASNETASVLTFIANRADGQSARKLMNGFTDIPDVYTLADDAATPLGANIINTNYITIPIGLATCYKGNMSLIFSGMDNYNATIKFVDADEKEEIDLTGKSSYQYDFYYTPTNADNDTIANESRFYIALSPLNITDININDASEVNTLVYAKDNVIYAIGSSDNSIQQVFVFDVQGRNLYAGTNLNAPTFSVNGLTLGAMDIYIVKVITEKGVKTVKVAP